MDNRLAPANVDAGDLPSGFSTTDPNGSSAAAAGQDNQGQQRQAQKDGILEQALTPDALERLRRIKVREVQCAMCCFLKYAYSTLVCILVLVCIDQSAVASFKLLI